MRVVAAFTMAFLLLLPMQTSAISESLWDDARVGVNGGSMGGISIHLSENLTNTSVSSGIDELPGLVEVYTATWCMNCVTSEAALDEAIGDDDIARIHYHRHKFETMDPFGSNSTEERWESSYGSASTNIGGLSRLAPATVFDGERIYMGTNPKSNSLHTDYSTSLSIGSSHPFEGDGTISLGAEATENGLKLYWDIDLAQSLTPSSKPATVQAWILFVEDNAYYPDGSNGVENYGHVLHEAVMLPSSGPQSLEVTPPNPWDGEDMTAILVLDWEIPEPESNMGDALPASGASTLLCMLAALVPRRPKLSR
tara:strand:+ start:1886 stop:2818 length:933 start_codon:yes stop_codon:yes gene_type:complete